MAKVVNMIDPETGGKIQGTLTDDEYEFYLSQGFIEVTE